MGTGPLEGIRVIEFGGMGPVPFCAMLMADLGAHIVRIDRKGQAPPSIYDIDARGRPSVAVDLKDPNGIESCFDLIARADILLEGYRPRVMERLGLGPDKALARNPKLIYGRMTGWGQDGPKADTAGHDINYVAITGMLDAIGTREKPVVPLNLAGDYGGGSMFLLVGILSALLHARAGGQGQVVDAAMADGAAYLGTVFHGLKARGEWREERAANLLDGGAPFYDTYRCADGKWISIGAIEPQFYRALAALTGLEGRLPADNMDQVQWPEMRRLLTDLFLSQPRRHWCDLLDGSDACFSPVLSMAEAVAYPQNVARGVFVEKDGYARPAPAPRFSGTPADGDVSSPGAALALEDALAAWS